MKITLKLFATLREHGEKQQEIEVPDGATVLNVIEKSKLPVESVSIIMINGRGKKLHDTLSENDVLALFPPVGGG